MAEKVVLAAGDAIALWKEGKDAWNQWVEENPESDVSFMDAVFSNHAPPNGRISFSDFNFPKKGDVLFSKAHFGCVGVYFDGAKFGDGYVGFDGATFGSGTFSFRNTEFGNGDVNFRGAIIDDGNVIFGRAIIGHGGVLGISVMTGSPYAAYKHPCSTRVV